MKRLLLILLLILAALAGFDRLMPEQAAAWGVALERWRSGLETRSLEVDGYQVVYNVGGEGEPLLLVHGFGADKDNWTRVAGKLSNQYRIYAIDLPGFGESSRLPKRPFDIESQTRRVERIAAELGLTRFHMGGSSMGGYITLMYAALFPQQLQSIWLLAPAGLEDVQPSELRQHIAESGDNALIVNRAEDFPSVIDFTMSKPPFLPYSVRHVLGQRAEADQAELRRIFDEINTSPAVNERIVGSRIPALVVWGEEDRALHVSGTDVLQELLVNASIIRRPGIGHLPMVEEPGRSAEDFLAFQAQLDKQP